MIDKVRYNLSIIKFNGNELDEAKNNLKLLIESEDIYAKSRANTLLGEIKLNEGEFKVAKDLFDEALDEDEIDKDVKNRARLGLGVAEYFSENYSEAIEVLAELVTEERRFEKDKVSFLLVLQKNN